jgi:hypothetical protein
MIRGFSRYQDHLQLLVVQLATQAPPARDQAGVRDDRAEMTLAQQLQQARLGVAGQYQRGHRDRVRHLLDEARQLARGLGR